jgi:hypothetical protein
MMGSAKRRRGACIVQGIVKAGGSANSLLRLREWLPSAERARETGLAGL